MIRVIVADDEEPAREELRYLLDRDPRVRIVGEAGTGGEAVALCASRAPDLAFLDIEMPGMNGIEAARAVARPGGPGIVFVTAYDRYAIKAFELRAVDYLLKPVTAQRLEETLSRFSGRAAEEKPGPGVFQELLEEMKRHREGAEGKITLYKDGSLLPLRLADIVYVTVEGRNTVVQSREGKFETSLPLARMAERLKGPRFYRCHRGFILNLDHVERVDYWLNNTYLVTMKGFRERIPVSRSYVREFRSILNIR